MALMDDLTAALTRVVDAHLATDHDRDVDLANALIDAENLEAEAARLRALVTELTAEVARLTDLLTPDTVTAGALPPGSFRYPVPADAVFVSPSGSDTAAGTEAAPMRTITAAAAAALSRPSATVVARGGSYEQAVTGYDVTIQPYPGEAVWLDGSRVQTTWKDNGDSTWTGPLHATFDHTVPPGYHGGQDPAWPMAVWPDMVHIDGQPLEHRPGKAFTLIRDPNDRSKDVAIAAEKPGPGQFTLDYTTRTVTIGTNPAGREVRLSALPRAVLGRAPGLTLQGIGIRRYATTLTGSTGTVDLSSPGVTLRDVTIEDAGQQGLALGASCTDLTIERVTVRRAGILGVLGNRLTGYQFRQLLVEGCNRNRWREQPSAAGIKLGRAVGGLIRDSIIRGNRAAGLWWDVSCRDNVAVNLLLDGNTGPAVECEIGRGFLLVNLRVKNTGTTGVWGLDARGLRLWNSSIDRALSYDLRLEEDNRAGKVPSWENPDGTQDWQTADAEVCNVVLTNETGRKGGWRLYAAPITPPPGDDGRTFLRAVGGVVWSAEAAEVARMVAVRDPAGKMLTATSPPAAETLLGSRAVGSLIATTQTLTPDLIRSFDGQAVPVPADVAQLLGVPAGSRRMGPVLPEPVAA